MAAKHKLADLQLAIMRVLWQKNEATASEVHAALLAERGLAPTTIATMLSKMEQKGVVKHRVDGRQYVYRPAVRETEVRRTMVADLVAGLFQGDPSALVNHLLTEAEIDAAELERIRSLIHRRGGGERRKS